MPIKKDINLEEVLIEHLEDGEHLYLLVEGAGSNPVARERLFYESSDLQYIPIYANTEYAPIVKISPLLVDLDRDNAFFDWFIEEGPELRAGIIIVSRHNTRVVLRHLQGMIEVKMPDYNFAAFRYSDPKVLDCYINSVDTDAQKRLLGPLTAIFWPKRLPKRPDDENWEWEWCELSAPEPTQTDDEALTIALQRPIQVSQEQLKLFEWDRYLVLAEQLQVLGIVSSLNGTMVMHDARPWELPVPLDPDEPESVVIGVQLKYCCERYGFHSEDELMHAWNMLRRSNGLTADALQEIDAIFSDFAKFTTKRINTAYLYIENNCKYEFTKIVSAAQSIANVASNQKNIKEASNLFG